MNHQPLITARARTPLYAYMRHICRLQDQRLLAVNGTVNHVHLLLHLTSTKCTADMVRDIKALSSRFMNEKELSKAPFYWEKGYRAFTCSHAQVSGVIQMIRQQETYHQDKTLHDEYLDILGERNLDFSKKDRTSWAEVLSQYGSL